MIEKLLLSKEFIVIYGPLGLWAALASYACFKLWNAYLKVQEQRLTDAQKMRDMYHQLVTEINKTLDILIKVRKK